LNLIIQFCCKITLNSREIIVNFARNKKNNAKSLDKPSSLRYNDANDTAKAPVQKAIGAFCFCQKHTEERSL